MELPVQSCLFDGLHIPAVYACDVFLHVQPFSGPLPIDFRNLDMIIIPKIGRYPLGISALCGQIQLPA